MNDFKSEIYAARKNGGAYPLSPLELFPHHGKKNPPLSEFAQGIRQRDYIDLRKEIRIVEMMNQQPDYQPNKTL